jgi:outer membrane protein TolC
MVGNWAIGYGSQADSLQFYLETAAKNNPTVLQKFAEYQAALQKVPQVGSLPDPNFSLGIFVKPMELVGGNQVADLRLMQDFPWFGVLKAAKDEMSLMAKAKFELFRDAKLQVYFDVQRTWFELYKNQQDIRISEKNLEILRTLERLSLVKFKAGPTSGSGQASSGSNVSAGDLSGASSPSMGGGQSMGGSSGKSLNQGTEKSSSPMQGSQMGTSSSGSGLADIYRIQIEISELANNIELLKNQQNTIVVRFNSYLNRPGNQPVTVPDMIQPDTLNNLTSELSNDLLKNNPMLGMLQFEQQSLEARKQMVTRMGYPMVGIGLNYSLINKNPMSTADMNGKDMIMPMVTLSLPVYRKKYKAMQSETEYLKEANKQGYIATANSLQTEYSEALQSYRDAQRRMKLYESQSQLAGKSLDITIRNFSASGAGLTDVLTIRQQKLDYEFKQVEALTDFNTAVAWINRLITSSQAH